MAGGLGWMAAAQQPKPDSKTEQVPTISVDVEVVNVLFTVRNKQGGLVGNLEKSHFTIEEDGRPQAIRYFSRQSDLPLTLGLLVDTSVSQGALLEQERAASSQFFSQMLRVQKDQAFLISFDVNVDMLQDLTDSVRLLRAGLDKLEINAGGGGGLHPGPVPTSRRRGTLLYDAVFLASDEVLQRQVGRKALALITDGVDYGSQMKLEQCVAAAHKADVIIYGILFIDRRFYARGGMIGGFGGGELERTCKETGGRMFEVDRRKPLKAVFDEIQQELRSQYSIGYTPEATRAGNAFRKIKVLPRDRSLKVQARAGYYPKGN